MLKYGLVVILLVLSSLAFSSKPIEPSMVNIPAGEFLMGSDNLDSYEPMKPVHKVVVKAFRIGKYEVTVKEFSQFISDTGFEMPKDCKGEMPGRWLFSAVTGNWQSNKYSSGDPKPVVCVGFKGAQAYAAWLAQKTGKGYRLPTEAEWEYVARGGKSTRFFFGDDIKETEICTYDNVADKTAENTAQKLYGKSYKKIMGTANCDDGEKFASAVGQYKPNSFGVYDVNGNVSEYLQDCANLNYEGAPADGAAWMHGDCERHAVRGGNWHWVGRSYYQRSFLRDAYVSPLEGFRLVQDVK